MTNPTLADRLETAMQWALAAVADDGSAGSEVIGREQKEHLRSILAALRTPSFDAGREGVMESATAARIRREGREAGIEAAAKMREALEACLVQAEGCWLNHYGEDPMEAEAAEPEHIAMARAALLPTTTPQAPVDIAAIEEAAYKRGWQDREDDLTLGVARLGAPVEQAQAQAPGAVAGLVAVQAVLAEMQADEAINAEGIANARREGNRHMEHELIGAQRDTRAWAKKLAAAIQGGEGNG